MATTDTPLSHLREIAETMRFALDGALRAAGRSEPAGSCALAAVLVRDAVSRFAAVPVKVRGGSGEMGEGARAPDGSWRGHYWVEADLGSEVGPVVIDITADQFGWPGPVCEPLAHLNGRYRPGDQEAVEEHMAATLEWIRASRLILQTPAP